MCGLSGILPLQHHPESDVRVDAAYVDALTETVRQMARRSGANQSDATDPAADYLGGQDLVDRLWSGVRALKRDRPFCDIHTQPAIQKSLAGFSERVGQLVAAESKWLTDHVGRLGPADVETMLARVDHLRDMAWSIDKEILENLRKIDALMGRDPEAEAPVTPDPDTFRLFKNINAVFNNIDRLEVRGRDSAGISLLFVLAGPEFERFQRAVTDNGGGSDLAGRQGEAVLVNRCIRIHPLDGGRTTGDTDRVAICLVYKVAAEVGSLGDNVAFLRDQVASDDLLRVLSEMPHQYQNISSHTRWASVGAISEPNCHPVDNRVLPPDPEAHPQDGPIIHVCLNGDIDNYVDLKREVERKGDRIPDEITTDTKIIPLQVERYIKQGFGVKDAFRLALNDFEGSHAIAMQTDLAPGKLFLGQRGSGQAIFVGLGADHYTVASEVYGFVEDTPIYLKLDGEKIVDGKSGPVQGQIFILDGDSGGGIEGIEALSYDGTPIPLDGGEIKRTAITSRDIDRQGYEHYFLKEITESPLSVEKTLLNRWKVTPDEDGIQRYAVTLDESVIPRYLAEALKGAEGTPDRIRRVFFVGQGTAGVAAQACADILEHYMNDPGLQVKSLKASELSGFKLGEESDATGMKDALVVAISQSGTTTDTNRTVDMVRARGAHTLAIVNRRDSDITFKVDGVMYTSSGRDIEMSVASTKAFYSQIVAGAILALYMARITGRRDDAFVAREIKSLLDLPAHMRKILDMRDEIARCADLTAVTRTYWAVVGSGPNKTSADEIRIKLSELCYKTISTDYVEDKKHIDLSSEPLIIVCAAGTRPTVIGDIIKDTAIFRAHKALPIVIADEGENRFAPYAEQVFHVPAVGEHLSPIVNTLVGHIWGYYAALAINQGSRFLFHFRNEVEGEVDACLREGGDLYEVILEKPFREKVAMFYRSFRQKKTERRIPSILGFDVSSDLTLLLKYLSGRLPASDFELDFGIKGTAINMVNTLFTCLGEAINVMSRPVDAIKHQAKTVTVGTSRISEKVEGLLFDVLTDNGFKASQLTPNNVMVLRNLQAIVSEIQGLTLYRIVGLNLLGEPTDETTIKVVKKEGTSEGMPSRVETDNRLKGTKRIIVRQGNVYIGKGRKDDRSIVFIPVLSESPATPNTIEYLLLLHTGFREAVALPDKVRALGGKYEHIKNLVQENSTVWEDDLLELVDTAFLFGRSAEKIAEAIVSRVNGNR